MRPITNLFMALLAAFIVTACSKEQSAETKPLEPASTTVSATASAAVGAAMQAGEAVKQKVEETAAAAKTEVKKSVEVVKEQTATATEHVKAVVTETAGKVKEKAAAAVKPAASVAKTPKVVTYPASMGTVTFDHGSHAARLACSKCHSTEPPATIVIDKEVAHALCRACHKAEGGKAPTVCAGCHVK